MPTVKNCPHCNKPWDLTGLIQDVEAFHLKYGLEYSGPPRYLSGELREFREKFLQEELDEYMIATKPEDKLDALIDLVYVAIGTAYLHGFKFTQGWQLVHAANMQKVRRHLSTEQVQESGRTQTFDIVKPAGWRKPDLGPLVWPIIGMSQEEVERRVREFTGKRSEMPHREEELNKENNLPDPENNLPDPHNAPTS